MRRTLVLLIVGLTIVAACGDEDTVQGSDSSLAPPSNSAMGPGTSIEEALALDTDQPVLVNGLLYVGTNGDVKLVSLFAESLPPQPGGAQLNVVGLDLDAYQLTEAEGIRWTDQLVQVLGTLDGDTLTVSNTISG